MPIIEIHVADQNEADMIRDGLEEFLLALSDTATITFRDDGTAKTIDDLRVEIAGFHAKIADRIFQIARMSRQVLAPSQVRRTLLNPQQSRK